MTEQEKKYEAKEGAQSANAEYIGLSEKPMSGEKNGKTWTKSKVKFKIDGRDNEWSFIVWSPLTVIKGNLDLLKRNLSKTDRKESLRALEVETFV